MTNGVLVTARPRQLARGLAAPNLYRCAS